MSDRTPAAQRKHIVLFGETNAGKSSLFNAILGQSRAIVSDVPGTTTDPVSKMMELLPFGPVVLVDTAGLSDESILGAAREKKTRHMLDAADLALYVIDAHKGREEPYRQMTTLFAERKLPYLTVLTKCDRLVADRANETHTDKSSAIDNTSTANAAIPFADYPAFVQNLLRESESCIPVSVYDEASVEALKAAMARALQSRTKAEASLIGDLLPSGSVVLMVIPIDSEAPVGRIIQPQVQLIRDCLDNGLRCHIANEQNLPDALRELSRIDLTVTDSQVFAIVNRLLPPEIPLTSFSILMARQKGDFTALYQGAQALDKLTSGGRVLIAEACTHNHSHEDIGRVKLPKLIQKHAGVPLTFDFVSGREFPDDLQKYQIIVHCGGCMITAGMLAARQRLAARQNIPMTNYGMALAFCNGILERSTALKSINPLVTGEHHKGTDNV